MKVRLLFGPRKGQVVEMGSAQARQSVADRLSEFVEPGGSVPVRPEIGAGSGVATALPAYLRRRGGGS